MSYTPMHEINTWRELSRDQKGNPATRETYQEAIEEVQFLLANQEIRPQQGAIFNLQSLRTQVQDPQFSIHQVWIPPFSPLFLRNLNSNVTAALTDLWLPHGPRPIIGFGSKSDLVVAGAIEGISGSYLNKYRNNHNGLMRYAVSMMRLREYLNFWRPAGGFITHIPRIVIATSNSLRIQRIFPDENVPKKRIHIQALESIEELNLVAEKLDELGIETNTSDERILVKNPDISDTQVTAKDYFISAGKLFALDPVSED